MDSRTCLDYALFQLTPTRTRCDLVVYAGGVNEKVASGLFQPFVQHLKTAKDQISRGGYSITLRPEINNAYWFTKATLQRFVRFVSSPEVLERFVTIEREIEQIESSILSNELSSADSAEGFQRSTCSLKSNNEYREDGTTPEENPKIRLQRTLETRKSVLRKEQAMAYARALVSGFEMEMINDLISFADAFGAVRLREACINFMELCKKKNQDRLWVDEIAAMQASRLELPYLANSGIILAGEENQPDVFFDGKQIDASVSDSATSHCSDINHDSSLSTAAHAQSMQGKAQVPPPWVNHPPYMHNFQGPYFQQMPPYQSHPFLGMQVPSPYFPGNMQWQSNMDGSGIWRPDDQTRERSSSRRKKSSKGKSAEDSIEENSTDASDSSSESMSDEGRQNGKEHSSVNKKKHKKSTRKVVIRNINYITSKEEVSDDEDGLIDGDDLKQQMEEAVGSLERRHKSASRNHKKSQRNTKDGFHDVSDHNLTSSSTDKPEKEKVNDPWGALQSLLMRDKDEDSLETESQFLNVQDEYSMAKKSDVDRIKSYSGSNGKGKQTTIESDSFIATSRETSNEGESHVKMFEAGEYNHSALKKTDGAYEELLFSQKSESGQHVRDTVADYSGETLLMRSQSEGDWFFGTKGDGSTNKDMSMNLEIFNDAYASSTAGNVHVDRSKKDVLVDYSIMIQAQPQVEDQSDSLLRTDIRIAPDIVEPAQYKNGALEVPTKPKAVGDHEPDDLYMVLGRESATDQGAPSWTHEMSFGTDILSAEANAKHSVDTAEDQLSSNGKNNKNEARGNLSRKLTGKDMKSKVSSGGASKNRSEFASTTKKPTPGGRITAQKSKSKEEEERKRRTEELLAQRQKRIAERSAGGINPTPAKKGLSEKRPALTSAKTEKPKTQFSNQETKKTVLRNSTIDRLATARTIPKELPVQSKSAATKRPISKANNVPKKTATVDKKQGLNSVKSTDTKPNKHTKTTVEKPTKLVAPQVIEPKESNDDLEDIKELHSLDSIEKNEGIKIMNGARSENKGCNNPSLQMNASTHSENIKDNNDDSSKQALLSENLKALDQDTKNVPEREAHPLPEPLPKVVRFAEEHITVESEIHEISLQEKISEIKVSATPPDESNPESAYSRKKWNNNESPPKAMKGFRKLLMFGRRSSTISTH